MQNNIFSTLFVGQNLLTLKEVDSTNNFLKELASNSKPVPEGTVIMAESQYAGRGQQQNTWHAEPGKNLTFSVLLKPTFISLSGQFDLTRAMSLGVYHALYPLLGDQLRVKWPNDVYVGDRKLGGMLIENMIQGGQIRNAIIGIGINVNQNNFPEGAANPTSISQVLHSDYELRPILSDICANIEAYYLKLKAGKLVELREEYLDILYWINEPKSFKANNDVFTGTITGVEDAGSLIVKKQDGTEARFALKEIEFLNKQ